MLMKRFLNARHVALLGHVCWAITGALPVTFRNIGGELGGEAAAIDIHRKATNASSESRMVLLVGSREEYKEVVALLDLPRLRLLKALTLGEAAGTASPRHLPPAGARLAEVAGTSHPDSLRKGLKKKKPSKHQYPLPFTFLLDTFLGTMEPQQLFHVDAHVGEEYIVDAPGQRANFIAVRRDGEIGCAVQSGSVRYIPGGAAIEAPAAETKTWVDLTTSTRSACREPFRNAPDDANYFCGPQYDNRYFVSTRFDHSEADLVQELERQRRNAWKDIVQQAQTLQNFTETGFAVKELPQELMSKLTQFYERERLLSARPELGHWLNPTLSSFESDIWTLYLPKELQEDVDAALRPYVAEWTGLAMADFAAPIVHGPRLYHNGSALHPHVDNLGTHAIGVVIHVARLPFEEHSIGEPWPLVVHDHSGTMQTLSEDTPGRVVLYESATCPHYRPGVFKGREFANIFVHYAPTGWPKRYLVNTTQRPEL
eukprot:TRINITY_DN59565_c0_g1_i1.p1 TRINITY_DN59565_c0_g1~~TRINITY_DN59565_c0_g1_i1.p1  ORF type:complete len:485 (+),score=64.32 TRINITY_DN59565_c0_g1_i1:99-1553(+)